MLKESIDENHTDVIPIMIFLNVIIKINNHNHKSKIPGYNPNKKYEVSMKKITNFTVRYKMPK